jgi:hypothetical protein
MAARPDAQIRPSTTPEANVRGHDCIPAVRIVATPEAFAGAVWPEGARVLPLAPDEVLVLGVDSVEVDDPAALVEPEAGFWVVETTRAEVEEWVGASAAWPLPDSPRYFVQGAVAGIPVKLDVVDDQALIVTRLSLRHDLEERL